MSYIGNTQNNQNYVPAVDFFSGNGSTTAFTLSRPVASVAAVQAVINNVPQNPGDAFTVSGSTITFTSAPPSGTNNIYVYYTSPNTQVVQPGQGTVGTTQLQSDLTLTNPTYTGTLTGGTGVVNIGSGQVYKDSSGNVGVGTNSPAQLVEASKSQNAKTQIKTTNTNAGVNASAGVLFGTSSGDNGYVGANGGAASSALGGANALQITNLTASPIVFATNSTERMRIDSSGTLLVGLTSNTYHTLSKSNSANYAAGVLNPNTTNPYGLVVYLNGVTGGSGAGFLTCVDNANRLLIAGNGNVTNVNGSYGTISDIKLKENIVDASSKLNDVMSLKVRNFNFFETPDIKQIGFIAQEFETVFPSMIEESVDRDSEGNDLGTTTKSIKTSVLVPILVKAIQELNEKVEAQAAEIAALKGAA